MSIPTQGELPDRKTVSGLPRRLAGSASVAAAGVELEVLLAAIIAPAAEDSLAKILEPLPVAQRGELVINGITQLARARIAIGAELCITADDLELMQMRRAGVLLARIISDEHVRLMPSECMARERALTEVAAILYVAHGRDLMTTERLLATLENYGACARLRLQGTAPPKGITGVPRANTRRREPLRRLVERTRQHDEIDRFLREQLRQIVHETLARTGHRSSEIQSDYVASSMSEPLKCRAVRAPASARGRRYSE